MNVSKLLDTIESTIREVDNATFKDHPQYKTALKTTKTVLTLLKNQVLTQPDSINQRVLRAMHDVGMSSYKDFENTPLENKLSDLTNILYKEIQYYKRLKPLRGDFGKGDPI